MKKETIDKMWELRGKLYELAHLLEKDIKVNSCESCPEKDDCRLIKTNRVNECRLR